MPCEDFLAKEHTAATELHLSATVAVSGVFCKRRLIHHRHSFQSHLFTAGHLDADVTRLASASPAELTGLKLKVAAFIYLFVAGSFFCCCFFYPCYFFFHHTLQTFSLSSDFIFLDSMSHSLLFPYRPVPSWSTKMEEGREYREALRTALTLTLPLRSLNLNWLNELSI